MASSNSLLVIKGVKDGYPGFLKATFTALQNYFGHAADAQLTVTATTPFSTKRKWCSVTFEGQGTWTSFTFLRQASITTTSVLYVIISLRR